MPATLLLASAIVAYEQSAPKFLEVITPTSLQAHEKFLSSDLLEGRGTPSRGLDIAAEYIATQFQIAGLQTPKQALNSSGDIPGLEGYFQVTEFENRRTGQKGAVKNVIGVIPGSDKTLSKTYVIVSGHYDHLGMRVAKEGESTPLDLIFNGANDDASGTTGVLECARALAILKPKRTIVFMCFWGEEMGLRGSSYYVKNPVFPLKDTVVDINLEQIGRTDDTEGARVSEFNLTGFDFTNLSEILTKNAKPFGVKVSKHLQNSDMYFFASDNGPFATAGVPANTISCAYEFPDYHGVKDEWPKLDYDNMAKIVRSVCNGVWNVANSNSTIRWNEKNPKTKRYVEAWKLLHPEEKS